MINIVAVIVVAAVVVVAVIVVASHVFAVTFVVVVVVVVVVVAVVTPARRLHLQAVYISHLKDGRNCLVSDPGDKGNLPSPNDLDNYWDYKAPVRPKE